MVAHGISFFFKHVLKKPFILPSKLYPRKEFRLPDVMSEEEVRALLAACESKKQKAIISVFYGTGVRLEECSNIKIEHVESNFMRLKVLQGKGRKDRYTLLGNECLHILRDYYKKYRPKVFLFEGQTPGMKMHPRSLQHSVHQVMLKAGFAAKGYSPHTLRHSFATHLLDHGTDLHTIKELLGHSKLETTMLYLHLQNKKRICLVSPLDSLYKRNDLESIGLNESALCR
jgi:site-specific recombinase XerD